ncbi:MAG: magnesium/cobalt transporter CorA [Clostridiaceae bacterium]
MQALEGNGAQPLQVVQYGAAHSDFFSLGGVDAQAIAALSHIPENMVRWIDADAGCPMETLAALGSAFGIHPIVLENIRDDEQRIKIEEFGGQVHLSAKLIRVEEGVLVQTHMNFILGPNYLLSFGRSAESVFEPIRGRLKSEGTQLRARGADYLLYALLDAIVDGYFDALEFINDGIGLMEEEIIEGASKKQLEAIRDVRRQLLSLTKAVWPLRDAASLMGIEASALIREETKPYFRDVYDHIVQAIDTMDTSRELVAGLAEMHFSNTSYKLNEIMKILTIISTIFIPLSFITGVYGMNFRYMPLLETKWGYYGTWAAMAFVAVGMLIYFKRKKWF